MEWARDENAGARAVERGEARLPAGATTLVVRRLACGAPYRLTVRAENAVGASPVLRPLLARTKGDSEFEINPRRRLVTYGRTIV